jgi:hypothetical protein
MSNGLPRRRNLPMRPPGTFGPVSRPGPADKIGDVGMVRRPPSGAAPGEIPEPWWLGAQPGVAGAVGSFKRGGKVKRTGLAKLHKGERVVKASTAKKLSGPKIAAAARKRPASRRHSALEDSAKKATKPLARKPAGDAATSAREAATCRCRFRLSRWTVAGSGGPHRGSDSRFVSRFFNRRSASPSPSSLARRYQSRASARSPCMPRNTSRFKKVGSNVVPARSAALPSPASAARS